MVEKLHMTISLTHKNALRRIKITLNRDFAADIFLQVSFHYIVEFYLFFQLMLNQSHCIKVH